MCGYLEARATYQLRSVSFIKSNKIQARMLTSCWNLSLKKVKIAHLDNFHVFSPIDQLWKTNFHGYVKRFKMRKESNLNLLIESTKFLISKFTVDWCSKNREEKRNPGATRRLLQQSSVKKYDGHAIGSQVSRELSGFSLMHT